MIDEVLRWGWLELWPHFTALFGVVAAGLASGHAILHKRDLRSVVTWLLLIWLLPLLGAVFYLLLGINRIKRRTAGLGLLPGREPAELPREALCRAVGSDHGAMLPLAQLTQAVVPFPLIEGNRVEWFDGGDSAYPEMLEAIAGAQVSVTLCSYIFDHDAVGLRFVDALAAAASRGVAVRVLVDAVGARYSWPRSILRTLRQRGVACAEFLPTRWPWRMPYANLRNHRKVLVIDGCVGFTGGMNLRAGHCTVEGKEPSIVDLEFRFAGPVVRQLQHSFAEDWGFSTGEVLRGDRYFPEIARRGNILCRGIADGPDEDMDKLRWAYHGGLQVAQRRVCIITPYFLPDPPLVVALASASLRGVQVDILLPAQSNLRLVHWATMGSIWQVLEHGCRVWLTPPPFDHTKLMVVDGAWVLLGSGNWDPRSLRLNFEFNVECYGQELGKAMEAFAEAKLACARRLTSEDIVHRSFSAKLRDGSARLFSPYL